MEATIQVLPKSPKICLNCIFLVEPWQSPKLEAIEAETVISNFNMSSGEWRGAVSNDGYEYSHTDDDERLSVSDSSSNSTVVKEEYHDESEIFGGSIGLFTGLSNLQRCVEIFSKFTNPSDPKSRGHGLCSNQLQSYPKASTLSSYSIFLLPVFFTMPRCTLY